MPWKQYNHVAADRGRRRAGACWARREVPSWNEKRIMRRMNHEKNESIYGLNSCLSVTCAQPSTCRGTSEYEQIIRKLRTKAY